MYFFGFVTGNFAGMAEIDAFWSDIRPTPGIDHFQNSDIFDVRRPFDSVIKGSTVVGLSK